jgi:hypothetical protein
MAKQPKQPDNRKTLGDLRKALTYDDVSMVRSIARLFGEMAKANPQLVKDVMIARATHFASLDATRLDNMVTFYADNADYLIELFETK